MSSCGAVVGGVSLDTVDIATQAVIQGVVVAGSGRASVGYVRLLDSEGDFVAEVPVSDQGEFRFFAAPGAWTVVALVPHGRASASVVAELGTVADIDITVR